MKFNIVNAGDAVASMSSMDSESMDCILIDPPYNIGVDFGNNKTKKEMSEYIDWCETWIHECERILKPSGTMFIYGFSEVLAHISIKMNIDYRWLVWHYTNKTVPSLNFWQRSH